MEEQPSDRLVDQRIRNRIMEAVETLADGDDGVPSVSTISADERSLLTQVSSLLDDACDATPKNVTPDELIATGWPKRIQAVAGQALNLMRQRGRFSEEQDEATPSA